MKLFFRIYGYLLLGIISLLLVEGNLSYEIEIQQYEEQMAEKTRLVGDILARMVAQAWQDHDPGRALQLIEQADAASANMSIHWVWTDAAQTRREPSLPPLAAPPASADLDAQPNTVIDKTTRTTFIPVPLHAPRSCGLELTQSMLPLYEFTRTTLIRSLLVFFLLALVSGLILFFIINTKIRKPLEQLSRKAMEIGRGDIDANLRINGNDELTGLAKIMNDMCTRLLIAKEKIHFENEARIKTLEQLRHAEKLSTIGQISASIAHELGTPLNVVDGRAKMIMSEDLEQQEVIECAAIIRHQAERMTNSIRQLLDFSRHRKPQKSLSEMETIIRQVLHLVRPLAEKQRILLEFTPDTDLDTTVLIDAQQIQQVLINILMNAIQSMLRPGTVTVRLHKVLLRSDSHTEGLDKQFLQTSVIDQGTGITEKNLDRIFDPFFTTKQAGQGTGLGLSIAKELLEEHGGWIEVDSDGSSGSCFSLYLPLPEVDQ